MRQPNKAETAIADQIIAMLDKGELPPWQRPWRYSLGGSPRNAISNREYSGINRWVCSLTQEANDWTDPRWLTAKQVRDSGGETLPGSKPTQIIFWKMSNGKKKSDEQEKNVDKPAGKRHSYPIAMLYRVYNIAQTRNCDLPDPPTVVLPTLDPIAAAEQIIQRMPDPPEIAFYDHSNTPPHYNKNTDRVSVPNRDRFLNADLFYNTMFHELTHATGHQSRLGRFKKGERPDLHDYGVEELVAGMGAALLADQAGLTHATIVTDASYINSWRNTIAADRRIVITAAQRAEKAARYITTPTSQADQC